MWSQGRLVFTVGIPIFGNTISILKPTKGFGKRQGYHFVWHTNYFNAHQTQAIWCVNITAKRVLISYPEGVCTVAVVWHKCIMICQSYWCGHQIFIGNDVIGLCYQGRILKGSTRVRYLHNMTIALPHPRRMYAASSFDDLTPPEPATLFCYPYKLGKLVWNQTNCRRRWSHITLSPIETHDESYPFILLPSMPWFICAY